MAATREDISKWFDEGKNAGKSHMVVVCDTWDYDDYPVFVDSADEARQKVANPGQMQRAMEVYRLSDDKQEQMGLHRCFRY